MTDLEFNPLVYLLDDDEILLKAMTQIFELDDIDVVPMSDPVKLSKMINTDFCGVIVSDIRMPIMDGIELFRKVNSIDAEIPVIFITGHADVPMVLKTLREGAFDFFSKPINSEHLLSSSRKAIETRRLVLENRQLKKLTEQASQGPELIGESIVMQHLRSTIKQLSQTDIDVLIEGETGTGKEIVASLLHNSNTRSKHPFVNVNCAALQSDLAEAILFGTAADRKLHSHGARIGKIEESHNGTLFLNKIEYLPVSIQGQLLPVIETREITPTIGDRAKKLNLRIIVSSQIDLANASENKEFRRDLLYRFNTVRLKIPPLRDRKEDVPLLFAHFADKASKKFSKKIPKMNSKVQAMMVDYDWPGNVRELKNFAISHVLEIENLNDKAVSERLTLPERLERFEANTIRSALEQTNGDVRESLKILGIPRKTFYDKLNRHTIDIKSYRIR